MNEYKKGEEPSERKMKRLKRINEEIAEFKRDEEFYKEKVRKTKEEYEEACQNLNKTRKAIEGTCYSVNVQLNCQWRLLRPLLRRGK
ncbi:unnamed protein product [Meloidogyne enterolobii]|uniref:Uncharacterized protein n=1 Tax=Meloidogyne enterolobii TaxID=390850 RepID=A0ACB1ACL5_MELEN